MTDDPRREMWSAVITTAALDLLTPNRFTGMKAAATRVHEWVGDFPESDFSEVCELAGLEPSVTHQWFLSLMLLSDKEKMLLRQSLSQRRPREEKGQQK